MRETDRTTRLAVYELVVEAARDYGLVLRASGGVMVLVHPDVQDSEGVADKCLRMGKITEKER